MKGRDMMEQSFSGCRVSSWARVVTLNCLSREMLLLVRVGWRVGCSFIWNILG